MLKRERIIQLVTRISSLRAELKRAETEFDLLVPEDETPTNGKHAKAEEPAMPARVLSALGADRTRTYDAQEIAKLIRTDDLHLVRSTLFRLAKRKKIRKEKRGQYGALHALPGSSVEDLLS